MNRLDAIAELEKAAEGQEGFSIFGVPYDLDFGAKATLGIKIEDMRYENAVKADRKAIQDLDNHVKLGPISRFFYESGL